MRVGSIRLRLIVAAVIGVVIALIAAEFGLSYLFERHVERRIDAELSAYAEQLVAGVTAANGKVAISQAPTDPRFSRPLSGLYWQVESADGNILLTSRSLWDSTIAVAADQPAAGGARLREVTGPDQSLLRAVTRAVRIATPAGEVPLRITVAIDHRDITAASDAFAADTFPSLAVLAVLLIAASWFQVSVGLAPLERVRTAVADIVSGLRNRLSTEVPSEVRPLAAEINSLLAAREQAIARARSRAADLAHALKTPLQVLAADVRALREKGEVAIADNIDEVATTLRRHVERELARARTGAAAMAGIADTPVGDTARRVVSVVERTPRGHALAFEVDIPAGLTVAMDDADLVEILGNLVENATRFAATRVAIAAAEGSGATEIAVADDGPGIPEAQRVLVLQRGTRLDTRPDGTGLGLAIVAETAEAYGGSLRLEDAGPGLKAIVSVPHRKLVL
jgi:signal transduction histidine kinase